MDTNKKQNCELTEESFDLYCQDIFHYVGGDYKPWWGACNSGDLYVKGYNGTDPGEMIMGIFEREVEKGCIVKKDNQGNYQDYLVEINIKVTKLKRIKEVKGNSSHD